VKNLKLKILIHQILPRRKTHRKLISLNLQRGNFWQLKIEEPEVDISAEPEVEISDEPIDEDAELEREAQLERKRQYYYANTLPTTKFKVSRKKKENSEQS